MKILPVVLLAVWMPVLSSASRADDYICDDETRLTATYQVPKKGLGSVELSFTGTNDTIIIPQVTAVDGVRYAGGVTEFWVRGSQASLRRGSQATTCKK